MAKHIASKFSVARFESQADIDVIESYEVNGAHVYITRDGRYQVSEPVLSKDAEAVWEGLMDNLYYSYSDPGNADVVQSIKNRLEEEAKQTAVLDIYNTQREAIEYYLIRDIVGSSEIPE